ncbi:MAG: aminomethyl-transferring glycine dehydrogenase subunit GcvPA [Halobacteria archaeon]|nr:aminomethyl-transferring glycine dehydrogenase subunit GcvPA [Halobacteria archaeon]
MNDKRGSPYTDHKPDEVEEMLNAVGVDDVQDLFDIPEPVRFRDDFGIKGGTEHEVKMDVAELLGKNADLTEFMGRGHYGHYVPSLVDHISLRSEFITSYTQYQPEIAQGFLQALFEYQSLLVELTGLEIANSSMYDHATALGEAALLSARLRRHADGDTVLVPDTLLKERRSVLENYVKGPGLQVKEYPTVDANMDVNSLRETADEDTLMIYAENPTTRGTIEEKLSEAAELAHERDALFCLGSDPVALALLERPADVGADIVVGDASALGLPTSYGMGLGMFVTREEFLRQIPGRLVGASRDEEGKRAYTLTLQTREQHIRRERATSNICTNQAWVALRVAIHAAYLGPSGLVELAKKCVSLASKVARRLDAIEGVEAPVHDRHHFREFVARTRKPAKEVQKALGEKGYGVSVVGDHEVQVCVTDVNEHAVDGFIEAFREVAG